MTDVEVNTEQAPLLLLGFPTGRYPTGWFQIGWSDDVGTGDVKCLHYFGRDIVLWRGESGRLHGSDPYCPHMGGHLGVKGTVSGDDIVCPWHAWQFNGDGRNTVIPYGDRKCKANARLDIWPVHEWHGMILAWHDLAGRPPMWEVPVLDELEDGTFHPMEPDLRGSWRIKAHVQHPMENTADMAHVKYIHGGEEPEIQAVEYSKHRFTAALTMRYGGDRPTWLSPDGSVEIPYAINGYGLGLLVSRIQYPGVRGVMLTNIVPIDETHCQMWFAMATERDAWNGSEPSVQARRLVELQRMNVTQDFFTWENQNLAQVYNLMPQETRLLIRMRRWAQQFYPLQAADGQANPPAMT